MRFIFKFLFVAVIILIIVGVSRYAKFFDITPEKIANAHMGLDENYDFPEGYRAFAISSDTKTIGTYVTNDLAENFRVQYVTGEIDFEEIRRRMLDQGKTPIMITAAAFTPDYENILGFALEEGKMAGEPSVNKGLNGLLIVEDGRPRIAAVSEISNWEKFIEDLQKKKASLFQQTSYIRPGGSFSSSTAIRFELRFFIEGSLHGNPTQGIVDFSVPMTYTQAVEVLQNIEGLQIDRAIGLDTGYMSEAKIYDERGDTHVLFDENVAPSSDSLQKYRSMFTNVIVVYIGE